MSYVLQLADDPHFSLDQNLVRTLHYMMLAHDLSKSPGRYRLNSVFVVDEGRGEAVYEAPDFQQVPVLCQELVSEVATDNGGSSFVRAAMAHLNLVMIHPFRDGNGRMARCLQTLLLARDRIVTPEFSSVEEFLGSNTPDYYSVLGKVGQGSWNPQNSARAWVKFILRAHHFQAQTVVGRLAEASFMWSRLEDLAASKGVPSRSVPALYDASLGLRIRRSAYMRLGEVEERTATRDLQLLVDSTLLVPQGERRGRTYAAGDGLRSLRTEARRQRPKARDPYAAIGGITGILQDGGQAPLPF